MEGSFIYKIERSDPIENSDYAIRFDPDAFSVHAKPKGASEFSTSFDSNNTAYEVYLNGVVVSEDVYLNFN